MGQFGQKWNLKHNFKKGGDESLGRDCNLKPRIVAGKLGEPPRKWLQTVPCCAWLVLHRNGEPGPEGPQCANLEDGLHFVVI